MGHTFASRDELEGLYAEYNEALDDGAIERWPSFFATTSSYRVTTRENVERGWPMTLLHCESYGMILDRSVAIQKTLYFLPRMQRRVVSGIRVTREGPDLAHVRCSFAVFETLAGEHTKVLASGRAEDVVIRQEGALKFSERACVLDASLVPNSLPVPV